jgi:hypothetical protein
MTDVMTAAGLALCASLHVAPCTSLNLANAAQWECYGSCTVVGPPFWSADDCVHESTFFGPGWHIDSYLCPKPEKWKCKGAECAPTS